MRQKEGKESFFFFVHGRQRNSVHHIFFSGRCWPGGLNLSAVSFLKSSFFSKKEEVDALFSDARLASISFLEEKNNKKTKSINGGSKLTLVLSSSPCHRR